MKDSLLWESRLVLATAHRRPEGSHVLRELTDAGWDGSVDWPLLIYLAQRESALPALVHALTATRRSHPGLDIDDDGLKAMQRLRLTHALRLGEMQRKLRRLAAECESASIPLVLLKGSGLVHALDLPVIDRPMWDVDLLVHPEHSSAVWEIARGLDWAHRANSVQEEVYEEHHHLPPLVDGSGLFLGLEIHTEIFQKENPFHFAARDLWREAVPIGALPGTLRPSWEHMLIHNSIHFAWSHALESGTWKALRDTGLLVTRPELQWDQVVRTARQAKAESTLWWTLHLATEWGNVPVDPDWLETLEAPTPKPIIALVRKHYAQMFAPPSRAPRPPVKIRQLIWEAALRPGRSEHGTIRPWARTDAWKSAGIETKVGEDSPADSSAPDSLTPPSPVRRRLDRVVETTAYVRGLLGK